MIWIRDKAGLHSPTCLTEQASSQSLQPVHFLGSETSTFADTALTPFLSCKLNLFTCKAIVHYNEPLLKFNNIFEINNCQADFLNKINKIDK